MKLRIKTATGSEVEIDCMFSPAMDNWIIERVFELLKSMDIKATIDDKPAAGKEAGDE